MGLRARLAVSKAGRRAIASAELRENVLEALHQALQNSGMSKSDLARELGIGKSAVGNVLCGDGNLRVNTIAEYLDAAGAELSIGLAEPGSCRVHRSRPGSKVDWAWQDFFAPHVAVREAFTQEKRISSAKNQLRYLFEVNLDTEDRHLGTVHDSMEEASLIYISRHEETV